MNPFSAGRKPKGCPAEIQPYGQYAVITSWKDDEEFAEIIKGCTIELLKTKERMKEELNLIEIQASMEMVLKAWPEGEKPVGYSFAIRFLAKKNRKEMAKNE